MDRRKIIIATSIIAILALLGGGYWYLAKKNILPAPAGLFPGEAGLRPPTGGEVAPTIEEEPTPPGQAVAFPRLYELHKTPVAGVGFYEVGSASFKTITARYVERSLGHIYETPLVSIVNESRIVNETRPRIVEALWGNNGKSIVLRSIDDKKDGAIVTRILNLGAPSTSFAVGTSDAPSPAKLLETEEVFLPYYIPFMAVSEDGADSLFYLENSLEASVGSFSTFKYFDVSKVFSSSFTEWLPQFPNKNLVTLTTKPSSSVPGHLFFIDQKTSSVKKIFGGTNGLTTLTSPDGKSVLMGSGSLSLSLYSTISKKSFPLFIKTLPEKCVFSKKDASLVYCAVPQTIVPAEYPDQWYQGVVAFSDDLWQVDISTMVSKKILSPIDFDAPSLDIINPTLSSDDAYILFMNKLTGTPWVYRISEERPQSPAPPAVVETPITETSTQDVATTTNSTTTKVRDLPSTITDGMKKIR